MNPLDSLSSSGSGLIVNGESAGYLKATGSWARFLAIVGFCCIALLMVFAFFVGSFMESMGVGPQVAGMEFMLGLYYFGIAVLNFFPALFLFRFASNAIDAVQANDAQTLVTSLRNLKLCFQFIGILTAIGLGFLVMVLVIAMVAGSMM
jgi:hypothetical protein